MEEKEYKPDKICVATEIQYNVTAEADAIEKYNHLLQFVRDSDLPKNQKEVIESNVYEIISDELNHQERLQSLYTLVTGIKPDKD